MTSFGGRVDKIIGDAIVALFGAPVAHEDDAERAVRAALRMQRSIAELAADLDLPIRMRIGVNTGEVLVGALRAGGDYTAMGDVVNTANRLQTAAPPGGVLVGPATHAATEGAIAYESVGEFQVRGRDEQVAAWLALEPLTLPGPAPAAHAGPVRGAAARAVPARSTPCGWPRASGGPSWPSSRARAASARPAWSRRCSTPRQAAGAAPSSSGRACRTARPTCGGRSPARSAPVLDVEPGAVSVELRARLERPPVRPDRPGDRRGAPRRPRQRPAAPVRPAVTARRHRPGPHPPGAHPGRPGRARRAVREGSGHDGHRRPPLGQPAGARAAGGRAGPAGLERRSR